MKKSELYDFVKSYIYNVLGHKDIDIVDYIYTQNEILEIEWLDENGNRYGNFFLKDELLYKMVVYAIPMEDRY